MRTAKSINRISGPRCLRIACKAALDKPLVDRSAIECRAAFAEIKTAIEELRAGRMIIVVDDEDRENEGDLTMAAEKVTPEAINFMASYGRGLICLAMTGQRLDELELGPMAPSNTARSGTAFTVSIDALGRG